MSAAPQPGALTARFAQGLRFALRDEHPARVGLAVSGGGDSMAMLDLAATVLPRGALAVATVDHGLRPGSADEARLVARACAARDLPHDTLRWQGWNGRGNLQAAARAARRALLADWAKARGIRHILLAHTAEDQAETVLMEIARKAGAAGRSGMAVRRVAQGITWLRPMLALTRAELRDHLTARGLDWADDPSNEDPRFARVRARQAIAGQPGAREALAGHARVQAARHLEAQTEAAGAAPVLARLDRGEMRLPLAGLMLMTPSARRLLLGAALRLMGRGDPGPRGRALDGLVDRLVTGEGGPLHGVMSRVKRGEVVLCRDVSDLSEAAPGAPWDGRWEVPAPPGSRIGPLGDDLLCYANRRDLGLSRSALMASPAIRQAGVLIAAPLLDGSPARYLPGAEDFIRSILSH